MNYLKKINRGLLLTAVILLGIAIYLVVQSAWQNTEKTKIESVCRQYIDTAVKYGQLPEMYRKDKPDMPQKELEDYISNMTAEFGTFYQKGDLNLKSVINRSKASLEDQAAGKGVIFSLKKDILEFSDFIFEGKTVVAGIKSNTVLDGPSASVPGTPRASTSAQTSDTITLRKTDGEWKIVYADLQLPVNNNMVPGTAAY